MESAEQRRELAAFLRSRRARIGPEAAGVPYAHGRRRTPGLRREELAALAGVSASWYTWLEQARKIKVSRQVLGSLARVLKLDGVETGHLFRLAGEVPPSGLRLCTREQIADQYLALLEQLDPLPAFITNHRFDLLAWNQGLCVLLPGFEELAAERRNNLLLTFDPAFRPLFAHWEQAAEQVVALFRAQLADQVVRPEFTELVDQLADESPEFRNLWERMDLGVGAPASLAFAHPVLGRVEFDYVKLHLPDAEATLVTYQPPRDEALLAQLRELVAARRTGVREAPPVS
ncbi:transcriptional regulator with XRE-family HTH domain [Kitasatospora sp. MAP12-15]|uniref:helix-turn-helix transcriptional regulator n=1 Tax=unclassified Kitasatospora TaxID=2633591 RepID=UPI002476B83E|nr:helix-turn-helix transcriptional regulator [Kitasatospora sp. MAP12-44]MDH6112275.1 transcriptional regulator with XRE-family HTH domain [Kitasatospora sp. MAP12-44]